MLRLVLTSFLHYLHREIKCAQPASQYSLSQNGDFLRLISPCSSGHSACVARWHSGKPPSTANLVLAFMAKPTFMLAMLAIVAAMPRYSLQHF